MRANQLWLIAAATLCVAACNHHDALLDANVGTLTLSTSVEPNPLPAGETAIVTIEAKNPTSQPVALGVTSGSCQLQAFVNYEGEWRRAADERVCTADAPMVTYAPGQVQVEHWDWSGLVYVDESWMHLPPGVYEIVGVTGSFQSAPINLEITGPTR